MKLKKYTYPKFWLAEQFDFNNLPIEHNLIKNSGKSIAVAYHLWNTEAYMPYIYYSILSQLAYTDVKKEVDIYLFVQEELYDYAVFVFRNLLDKECIIKVSHGDAQNHMTSDNSVLLKYEIVVKFDADVFIKSNTGSDFKFYSTLKSYYSSNDGILTKKNHDKPFIFISNNKDDNTKDLDSLNIIDLQFLNPLTEGNEFDTNNLNLLKQIEKDFKKKRNKENINLVVARSWREFKKQQFVALCELDNKFQDHKFDIHININEEIDYELLNQLEDYLLERGHVLTIYQDIDLDKYALEKGATETKLEQFKNWKWIYHLLLYHKLNEEGVEYLLTYDDDIFFNEKPIGELLYLLDNKVPFACADQYNDSDKCMMGKLCIEFGYEINDEYYANTSAMYSTNSGFMGINNNIFKKFKKPNDFNRMLSLFEYRKWDHQTMHNLGYDDYKILLQEQSFLGILNRVFSNRTHRVLDSKDEYIISSDLEQIKKSKIEHYVSVSKYSEYYLDKLEKKFQIYREKVETINKLPI